MKADPRVPRENVFGHVKRLHWIAAQLDHGDRVVEFGCGTGCMLTLPLRAWGHDAWGVDIDSASIEYGRRVFAELGLEPDALSVTGLADFPGRVDAIIASEVLEHLDDEELPSTFALFRERLEPGGRLLVTVPNGYGSFELEALLWKRFGVGRIFEHPRSKQLVQLYRTNLLKGYIDSRYSSTLAHSPHRQRFTRQSIQMLLSQHGFDVFDIRGSVVVCGPISNTLLTGLKPFMRANNSLGDVAGRMAAGFYVAGRRV